MGDIPHIELEGVNMPNTIENMMQDWTPKRGLRSAMACLNITMCTNLKMDESCWSHEN